MIDRKFKTGDVVKVIHDVGDDALNHVGIVTGNDDEDYPHQPASRVLYRVKFFSLSGAWSFYEGALEKVTSDGGI